MYRTLCVLLVLALTLSLKVILNDELGGSNETFRVASGSLKNMTLEFVFGEFIDSAAQHGAEYLVLPELSLITLPEKVTVGSNPCNDEHGGQLRHALHPASCSAKRNKIYVSYTTFEIGELCMEFVDFPCWYESHWLYNTAVVFDREGNIIQKYRKKALFPPVSGVCHRGTGDPTYFTMDNGVKIGIFICFEIFTHRPAWELVETLGIDHIGYSTNFDDFPPITSLGVQQAYSQFFGVSFIAANNQMNKLDISSSGSGIYLAGNPLISTSEKEDVLLIADIPKHPTKTQKPRKNKVNKSNESKDLKISMFGKDDNVQRSDFIKATTGTTFSTKLSIPLIDCEISFEIDQVGETEKDEYYVAYVGQSKFKYQLIPTNLTSFVCGVINCGATVDECEKGIKTLNIKNIRSSTTFSNLEVKVQYNFDVDALFPLKNTNEKKLFDWGSFDFHYDIENNNGQLISTDLVHGQPLLFAGIGYFDLGM